MKKIHKEILDYKKWTGTRVDLVEVLLSLEALDKDNYSLRQKKPPHLYLPTNSRRLQQFIDLELIPKPFGIKYDFQHIAYYFFTIQMRKSGYTLQQLKGLYRSYQLEEVEERLFESGFKSESNKIFFDKDKPHLFPDEIGDRLKKLGRPEGRVLKTKLIRFAITPWCHATVTEKELKRLNREDIDVITNAFRQSLLQSVSFIS